MTYKPIFDNGEFRSKSPQFLLPNRKNVNILYTYIRKCGSTAFKYYMNDFVPRNNFSAQKFDVSNLARYNEFALRTNKDYFLKEIENFEYRIFVYRDPFERAISTYINKFCMRSGAFDIQANYEAVTQKSFDEASFRDFSRYLDNKFEVLDPHVWPQKSHLLEVEYTDAIPLRDLAAAVGRILGSEAKEVFDVPKNNSLIHGGSVLEQLLSDVPSSKLRRLVQDGCTLRKYNFDDPRVYDRIYDIYSNDYEMISSLNSVAV